MSTRSQVYFPETGIYLYQHYDGYGLFDIVEKAIAKKWRWDDVEYLTRIIFCEMVKENIGGETGYGIGKSQHGDIEYLVTVDVKNKTITEHKVYGNTDTRKLKFVDCK